MKAYLEIVDMLYSSASKETIQQKIESLPFNDFRSHIYYRIKDDTLIPPRHQYEAMIVSPDLIKQDHFIYRPAIFSRLSDFSPEDVIEFLSKKPGNFFIYDMIHQLNISYPWTHEGQEKLHLRLLAYRYPWQRNPIFKTFLTPKIGQALLSTLQHYNIYDMTPDMKVFFFKLACDNQDLDCLKLFAKDILSLDYTLFEKSIPILKKAIHFNIYDLNPVMVAVHPESFTMKDIINAWCNPRNYHRFEPSVITVLDDFVQKNITHEQKLFIILHAFIHCRKKENYSLLKFTDAYTPSKIFDGVEAYVRNILHEHRDNRTIVEGWRLGASLMSTHLDIDHEITEWISRLLHTPDTTAEMPLLQ